MEGNISKSLKTAFTKLKDKSREIKENIYVLYLSYKHPKTPWYAKVVAALIVSYALSPIDLIPDFIPILGYLDDIIIIPAGITLAIKLIPKEVVEDCKEKRFDKQDMNKKGLYAGIFIALFWFTIIFLVIRKIFII